MNQPMHPTVLGKYPDFDSFRNAWLEAYQKYLIELLPAKKRPPERLKATAEALKKGVRVSDKEFAAIKEKVEKTPTAVLDVPLLFTPITDWQGFAQYLEGQLDDEITTGKRIHTQYAWALLAAGLVIWGVDFYMVAVPSAHYLIGFIGGTSSVVIAVAMSLFKYESWYFRYRFFART